MARISAAELIARVLDADSFASWDTAPVQPHAAAGSAYAAELAAATERSGVDEAVVSGEGTVDGRRVAVIAGEFTFLGGSIGQAAAERLVLAVERATAAGLPLLVSPTSGGTRMQEGTLAFLQMVKITAALAAHKAARLPYLVYLRHPTTGGVLASWGSLGHVTGAEPGALIGFLGPRVYEALYGETFPAGVQQAENLYAHGLIDAVVAPEELREIAIRALNVLMPREEQAGEDPYAGHDAVVDPETLPDVPAWESIEISRSASRPGTRHLLRAAATDIVPLNGTAAGEHDPGLLLVLARFGGASCVVLGQDRRGQTQTRPLGPAALREARRGMALASELGLPLVTLIDTPGAALSKEAEEGGLAAEIARCLEDLVTLDAPTLSVILGQGTGGGALALIPADRCIAAEHGWLSPLPPEGASAIIHRTVERAPQMAQEQGVRSRDLYRNGIIDAIVPELPDAATEPRAFCLRMAATIRRELRALTAQDPAARYASRLARYRRLGA